MNNTASVRRAPRQNIFNTTWGVCQFAFFWAIVILHLPFILIVPRGRASVAYSRFFFWTLARLMRVRVRVNGKISSRRPLLLVCNHISVFEFATFPIALGAGFFGKKEIASMPLVGWIAKKFGVVFIDRRPSHAMDALVAVRDEMARVSYPMVLFPEGTTTNGAYVKEFKSSLFNVVENADIAVQPLVMHYRFRDGTPINDEDLAQHYAYFDNAKQDMGPRCKRERSAFGQIFHVMVMGGFLVEITILPVQNLKDMDRKQMAAHLHGLMSAQYMQRKDKKRDE